MMTARVLVSLILIPLGMAAPTLLKLNNGRDIPAIALGTYLGFNKEGIVKSSNNTLRNVILEAIDLGYRHFDTASIYKTETELGDGVKLKIKEGVVGREDVFITTKLWNTQHKREDVEPALKESLQNLGLDDVDLYLMHWPMGIDDNGTFMDTDYLETWKGMEEIYEKGLAKSIGVSNFNQEQLKRLLQECRINPAVLQIEVHPQLIQSALVEFAQSKGLVVMGASPFGALVPRYGMGQSKTFNDPTLQAIAEKYNKTPAQVVLRWQVDRNIIPIPKAITSRHLKLNIDIFDFKLDTTEVLQLNQEFDLGLRLNLPSFWQSHPYYPFDKVENPIKVDPLTNTK